MCAIDEYASIRFTLSWLIATRFPSVIVAAASSITTGSQSAFTGPSAPTKSRNAIANAPTLGPTDRYAVTGVGEP